MSRGALNFVLSVLAVLAIALPSLAGVAAGKDAKTTTVTLDVLSAATLAGKEIKPGTYRVAVDGTKVTLARDGKVVAEAPVQWMDETSKASYSSFVIENNHIKEIHFSGKMQYVKIME